MVSGTVSLGLWWGSKPWWEYVAEEVDHLNMARKEKERGRKKVWFQYPL